MQAAVVVVVVVAVAAAAVVVVGTAAETVSGSTAPEVAQHLIGSQAASDFDLQTQYIAVGAVAAYLLVEPALDSL